MIPILAAVPRSAIATFPVSSSTRDAVFTATLLGSSQGAISVLLTSLIGYACASSKNSLLGTKSQQSIVLKRLSQLSSKLFLPCLIISTMGPQLTFENLKDWWIMPLWGLISSFLACVIAWVGTACCGFEMWTIVAAARANAVAFPLLLIESLMHTGVLGMLQAEGETVQQTLSRAKSIVLLNFSASSSF